MNDTTQEKRLERALAFLRSLRDKAQQLGNAGIEREPYEKFYRSWQEWRSFAARVKAGDAKLAALLKTIPEVPEPGFYLESTYPLFLIFEGAETGAVFFGLALILSPVLIPFWIYRAGKKRKVRKALREAGRHCSEAYALLFLEKPRLDV